MARLNFSLGNWQWLRGRGAIVALILIAALIGFEIFNFDTTKFALLDLMGGRRFLGIEIAAILAFAFCSIDFAGLIRMFTPEQGADEPKEVWLLIGAWLLGASMNAVMTWYAVSLLIAPRNVGAMVVSKENMMRFAPLFVAMLVLLTRVLFIGSISVTMDRLMHGRGGARKRPRHRPVRDRRHFSQTSTNGQDSYQDDLFEV
mgnify:CR=1 FL=1